MRELTLPFPVNVIARMLGLPREDLPQFHRWAIELISVSFDWDRGTRASAQLRDYFARVLADRRAHPADDLMSILAAAELDGQHLTDEEIFAFLRLLLPAGAETTYRSSSNLLFGLLTNPAQLDALRADRRPDATGDRGGAALGTAAHDDRPDAPRATSVVDGVDIPSGAIVDHQHGLGEPRREVLGAIPRSSTSTASSASTSRSRSGRTCASACTWRGWRPVWCSNGSSTASRTCVSTLRPTMPHITGMTFRAPPALPVLFG